jgi:hypothetical protein
MEQKVKHDTYRMLIPIIGTWWLIKRIFWRLQFKKVKFESDIWMKGRCIDCAAGNPKVECCDYYCPCKFNEQLKRVRTFNWL